MLPTSRYMGGLVRPRNLHAIARSTRVNLERLKTDQLFFPDETTTEKVPSSSRTVSDNPVEAVYARSPQKDGTRVDAPLFTHRTSQLSFTSPKHARDFHSSSCVPYDSTSYTATHVPDFLVRYKEHRGVSPTTLETHVHNNKDAGLMQSLTDSILSDEVVASIRHMKTKIPVEHHIRGGPVVHTSGYVIPGLGHTSPSDVGRAKERERDENMDRERQRAAIRDRVLELDLGHVDATTLPSLYKVPLEVRERDGTIKHASGFIPPTPSHKFRHHKDVSGFTRERRVSAMKQKAPQVSPGRGILRTMHTTQASGDS